MQEDFKVTITGDISGLKKAVTDAEKLLSDFSSKNKGLKPIISDNIVVTNNYDKAIAKLKSSFEKNNISQNQFAKSLEKLKSKQSETAIETAKLRKQIEDLKKAGTVFTKTTPQISGGLNTVDKNASGATNTMMEFSRVVQDAPYGIRGVANNIQQLVGNFGYLSKSAGGAGAAFKAMASSLLGPAGILLAVSLVTSALVQYGDEITNMIKGNGELAASQKEVTEALNDFYGGSVTKMNTYVSILENVNTTETERKRITDELIELVPTLKKADFEYGKNLDIVKTKIGQYVLAQASRIEADTLVQENSEILAKKAKITQIQSIDDGKKRLEEFTKFLKSEGKSLETTKGIDATSLYMGGGGVGAGGRSARKKTGKEITDEFNKLADDLEVELKPIQDRITELYGVTFSGEGGGKAEVDTTAFEELVAKQGEVKKALENSILTKGADAEATRKLKVEYSDLSKQIQSVRDVIDAKAKPIRLPATLDIKFSKEGFKELEQQFAHDFNTGKVLKDSLGQPIPIGDFKILDNLPIHVGEINSQIAYLLNDLSKTLPNGLFADLTKMSLEQLQSFSENVKITAGYIDVLEKGIEMTVSNMAFALGKALAEGGNVMEALGASLLGSLGSVLVQMGEMAIAIGIGLTAISSALASLSAPLAIGAGIALIALGSFFASKSAEIGSFAGGGIVPGGSFNGDKVPAFVNSGEMILNAGQQSNLFDILDGNLRKLGGQQQMQTIRVEGSLRGQTMLLQNKRSERDSNRFYGRK